MKALAVSILFVGVTLTAAGFAFADDAPRSTPDNIALRVSSAAICDACGPGPGWVAACTVEGVDVLESSGAEFGIFLPGGQPCSGSRVNYVVSGSVTVHRDPAIGTQIVTEITNMDLGGSGLALVAGMSPGNAITQPSLGTIQQQDPPDDALADSTFDVYFEAELPGIGKVWNHGPLHIEAVITCVPPDADYVHPAGQCVGLYDDPTGGVIVAYLGNAKHDTVVYVPTVSEWGLIFMGLLAFAAGTIMYGRWRRVGATG